MTERTICIFPDCEEPRSAEWGLHVCDGHVEEWNSDAKLSEWHLCLQLLEPIIKTAEVVGNEALVEVLEGAQDRAEGEILFWEARTKRLQSEDY